MGRALGGGVLPGGRHHAWAQPIRPSPPSCSWSSWRGSWRWRRSGAFAGARRHRLSSGRPPPPPPSSRRHLHSDLELHLLVSSRVVPSLQIVAGRICVGVMRAAAVAACGGSRQEEGHWRSRRKRRGRMRQAEHEEVEGLQAGRAGGTHGRGKERESPRMRAEWVGCLFFWKG
jgi:hypothetical protein